MSGHRADQSVQWLPASKAEPPQLRVSLIERQPLLHMLDTGRDYRLTLVHAPAGYGKTTLLTQWYRRQVERGAPVAWFAIDEDDNDPVHFLSGLACSLGAFAPAVTDRVDLEAVSGGQWSLRQGVEVLLSALSDCGDLTWVLDDCHLIDTPEAGSVLDTLLQLAPQNLRIILGGRNRASVSISDFLLMGQVLEITVDNLRMTQAEIARVFDGALTDASLKGLAGSTEGWPMAVQLARLWAQGFSDPNDAIGEFSGTNDDVATYLTQKIMNALPEDGRRFLLETSVVDQINGDLANAIQERSDGWQVLRSLEHLGTLLSPLDPSGNWYRFHHLFSMYLRDQLKTFGEDHVCALHRRAAAWFARNDYLVRAVKHSIAAGEPEVAAELIEKAGGVWLSIRHGAPLLRRVLRDLPSDVLDRRPRLRVARALLWMKDGALVEARKEMADLRNGAQRTGAAAVDTDLEQDILMVSGAVTIQGDDGVIVDLLVALEAQIGVGMERNRWFHGLLSEMISAAYLRRGNTLLAYAAGREALRFYEEFDGLNGRIFSRIHLGNTALMQGNLSEAISLLSEAVDLGRSLMTADTGTISVAELLLARAYYERNELDRAEALCFPALERAEHAEGWFEVYHAGYITARNLCLVREQVDRARTMLERGQEIAARRGLYRLRGLLTAELGALKEAGGKDGGEGSLPSATLAQALDAFRSVDQDSMPFLEREERALALGRRALAEGEAALALDLLGELQARCEELGRGRSLIRVLLLKAQVFRQMDKGDQVAATMRRAVQLAAPERWVRLFVDEGKDLRSLLDTSLKSMKITQAGQETMDFLTEVFTVWKEREGAGEAVPKNILRTREIEVLSGLDQGLSNKMIARQLDLTEDAIKYHLKKIFSKLGVRDRRMAVQVARKFNILD